jgi:hypothetical protein
MKVKYQGMLIFLDIVGLLHATTTSIGASAVSFMQTLYNVTEKEKPHAR